MAQAELLVRIGLALVFAVAATGKLTSRSSSRLLLETFGLDRRLAPAARALPVVELAVAVGLLMSATARGAGTASFSLLTLFSSLLVRNLHRGVHARCNCFGGLGGAPTASRALVRNAVLLSASLLVALSSVQAPLGALRADVAAGSAASVVGAVALLVGLAGLVALARLPRRDRHLLDRAVVTLDGSTATLAGRTGYGGATLVFIDPACGPCRTVVPSLRQRLGGEGSADSAGDAAAERLLVVTRGAPEANRALLAGVPERRVILDEDGSLAGACGVQATPAAVAIVAGRVEPIAAGAELVVSLLEGATRPSLLGTKRQRGTLVAAAPSREQRDWTRREALTAATTSAVAVLVPRLTPLGRVAARLEGRASGVVCPACGSCVICQQPGPSSTSMTCRPCLQKCSAKKLCAGYANTLPAYQKIAAYLLANGYTQSGEPEAAGLAQGSTLTYFGTVTNLTSKSATSPKALLVYGLTNSGGSASAAILDPPAGSCR